MNALNTDTLEYQLTRPGVLHRDMSAIGTVGVVNTMLANKQATEYPEVDALRFYMANHAVMVMRQRYLPKEPLGMGKVVLDRYHKVLAETAPRMFHYLLKICTREMRHTYDREELRDYIIPKYGMVFWQFYKKIKGTGSTQAVNLLKSSPPDMPIGNYVDGMFEMFNEGDFSGGYGGKAWAQVAHCLREFVHGRYSAEMMMDTAFTLCHNNGPIFNKGMEFHGYDSHEIVKILDVQRSGQIPQLVRSGGKFTDNKKVNEDFCVMTGIVGSAFEGYVDWFVVEALGSMKHYPSEKKLQVQQHGESKEAVKAKKLMEAKQAAAEAEAAEKLLEQEKNYYKITDNIVLKKVQVRE